MMNPPAFFGFLFVGVISIIVGVVWILRLFLSNGDEDTPINADDDRLINIGFGQYKTERLVLWRGIMALIVGIILIVLGILS